MPLNYFLCALGGLAIALPFVAPAWGPVAWIAFAPLLWAAPRAPSYRQSVALGMVTGVVANGVVCWWLIDTITIFGGFPWALAGLFYAVLILYTGIPFAAVAAALRFAGPAAPRLLAPALWVGTEYLFPNLFPWRMAYTQREFPLLIQSADIAGPFLLSFAILWCNAALVRPRILRIVPPLILVGLLVGYGQWQIPRIQTAMQEAPSLRVGLVQGNLSLFAKRDPTDLDKNLSTYRRLSESLQPPPDLLVWPETVVTWGLPQDRPLELARDPYPEAPAALLFGAVSYRQTVRGLDWYNSLFLRKADGTLNGRYDKMVLMPFGEFLPFSDRFPIIRSWSPNTGDFQAGTQPKVLSLNEEVRIGPAICYEDMMTTPLGTSAAQGANLLISVANDAWYGDSAALLLHETLGQWRAVENRRYFLRATNSGLTSAIDPLGRRFFELPQGQSAAGTLTARLLTASTLYQRHPDRFPQFVLGLGLVLLGWSRATKFRGPEDAPD